MSSTQGPHSLAFRVMRLCRPSLHVEIPVRFDPSDLLFGEDLFDDPVAASHLPRLLADTVSDGTTTSAADPSDLSYRNRFLLQHPSDSLGLPGLLLLPQSFGFASFCFLYLKCQYQYSVCGFSSGLTIGFQIQMDFGYNKRRR